MKSKLRRLLAALLCLAALCGSALAIDTKAFLAENKASLEARGIERVNANKFHDGLLLVWAKNTWGYKLPGYKGEFVPDRVYNYINEKGEIVDLNRGRFDEMHPFSEGLAPVSDVNTGKVGYIDTTGKLVIPCKYGIAWGAGDLSVGYFWKGQCIVLEKDSAYVNILSPEPGYWSIGKIDKTGKLIEPFHTEVQRHGELGLVAQGGTMYYYEEAKAPKTTLNQSTYTTTSFELYNPLGYFDSIASEHRVHYKLENKTASVDQVDIAVIPCVLGEDFDFNGSMHLIPGRYYPLTTIPIQATLEPGGTARGFFMPEWGWDPEFLKYIVVKLDPGDMELLEKNGIGGWNKKGTHHPMGRTEAENKLASDFVYQYFSDYLK